MDAVLLDAASRQEVDELRKEFLATIKEIRVDMRPAVVDNVQPAPPRGI